MSMISYGDGLLAGKPRFLSAERWEWPRGGISDVSCDLGAKRSGASCNCFEKCSSGVTAHREFARLVYRERGGVLRARGLIFRRQQFVVPRITFQRRIIESCLDRLYDDVQWMGLAGVLAANRWRHIYPHTKLYVADSGPPSAGGQTERFDQADKIC